MSAGQHTRSVADRLADIRTIADTALSHLDLDSLLHELVARVRDRLGADSSTILLLDEDETNLRIRASIGREGSVTERLRIPIGRGLSGQVAAAGVPLVFADISREEVIGQDLRERSRSYAGAPMISGGRTIGVLHVGSSEPGHFTDDDVVVLEVAAERAAVAVENWRLYQAEQSARVAWQAAARRLGRLGAVIARLAAGVTESDVADTVTSEAMPFLGATGLWIYRLDPAGTHLELSTVSGYGLDTAEALRRAPMSDERPSVRAVRTGEPVFVATRQELMDRFPRFADVAPGLRPGASAAFPLAAGGDPFGALVLQWDTPRRFDEEERSFLSALANQVAQALERARLYQAEHDARASAETAALRTRVLQDVTSGMSGALTTEDVASALIERGLRAVGAEACVLYLRSPDGDALEVAGADGYEPGVVARFRRVSLAEATPVTDAFRSRRPVVLPDGASRSAVYPLLEPYAFEDRASAAFPLIGATEAIGAIGLTFPGPRSFGTEDITVMAALTDQAAIALERARLHDTERRERRRSMFLDAIGEGLARSLNFERTVARVARLAVHGVDVEGEHIDGLADWCAVDLIQSDGTIALAAIEHRDPSRMRRARELRERYRIRRELDIGVAKVLRTGEPELMPEIPPEMIARSAEEEDLTRAIVEFELRSAITVPLAARGRTFGAIELLSEGPGPPYTADDVRFAERVAERASFAIDNARLYRDRTEIARTLQRALKPQDPPSVPGVEMVARYLAAGEGVEVGGDFFEIWTASDALWLTIGDVTGKGPSAVDLNLLARHTIRTAAMRVESPAAVLRTLNRSLLERNVSDRFCTAVACRIDLVSDPAKAVVACGGHPLPIVVRAAGGTERVGAPGTLLGSFEDVRLPERRFSMAPGDTLVLYTDGVIEERRGARQFGVDGLVRVLEASAGLSVEEMAGAVEAAVRAFRPGGELLDDVALVVMRFVDGSAPGRAGGQDADANANANADPEAEGDR